MAERAFGAPGMPPTWSSSDKDFVTTALGPARLWATIGHGVINEVFWPSTGRAANPRPHLLSRGGRRLRRPRSACAGTSLRRPRPTCRCLTISHSGTDYRLTLEIVPDPLRDVLLVRFELEALTSWLCPRPPPRRDGRRQHGVGRWVRSLPSTGDCALALARGRAHSGA